MTKYTYIAFVFLFATILSVAIYTYEPIDQRVLDCQRQGWKVLYQKEMKPTLGKSGQVIYYYSYYSCEK